MDSNHSGATIKDIILQKISEVEKKHQVHVLHACEVGSRAWGLENANSDYDVKFIYVRRLNFYFSIEDGRRDLIDENSEYDMNGWDLRKALQLLRESNCSILEWIYSAHAYKTESSFLSKISNLATQCFCRARLLLAYWGKANKHYRDNIQIESGDGDVQRKKYLFVIQALLFAHWILAFAPADAILPPQDFSVLLAAFHRALSASDKLDNKFASIPSEIVVIIEELVASKRAGTLKGGPRIKKLDEWIAVSLVELEAVAKKMERKAPLDIKPFNDLIVEMVTAASGYRSVPEDSQIPPLDNHQT